jgi:hypothetical protein
VTDSTAGDHGLQAASDRIRETAKWLTVSLGAVGALLLAGTQLSSVGELTVGSQRFAVAVAGGVLAAIGTVCILLANVLVATTPVMSLTKLKGRRPPAGTKDARTDQFLLRGYSDVAALATAYDSAINARKAAIEGYDGGEPTPAEQAAQVRAAAVDGIVTRLVLVSSHMNLSHRWRVAIWPICIGAVVAAIGVVLFVWAANPPDGAKASPLTPGVLTDAEPAVLTLTPTGRAAMGESLACELDDPIDVLVIGSTDAGTDILVIEDGCRQVRAIITEAWGAVDDS